jgi:predicted DNA-binding transcriptional regulator YafY
MVAYLRDQGFSVTSRTVERDLAKLSTIFGYSSKEDGRSYRWFWPPDFKTIDIPGLDPATALAFSLAEKHLAHLLPPPTLDLLAPYFRRAGEVLDASRATPLAQWRGKVRVIGVGPVLRPVTMDNDVQRTVCEALLNERRVALEYEPRAGQEPKEYEFSPLAMVSRQGVIYLVGPLWDYENVVQLAMHRIRSVESTDRPVHVPKGFDIDGYIRDQAEFSYPTGKGTIKLQTLFAADAAKHLEERPLSDDQTIQPHDDERVRLKATVLDTDDLAWWLLGFGPSVEVQKPAALRRKIAGLLERAANRYRAR